MKTSTSLYEQLKRFGLNPRQWILQPIADSKYRILNHQDLSAYFIGEITIIEGQPRWISIQVAI